MPFPMTFYIKKYFVWQPLSPEVARKSNAQEALPRHAG
jgi:hypothetical protein